MIDYCNFDWGCFDHILGGYHKKWIIKEIFTDRCYEKYFGVENRDIVVDIGASIGPFAYSILDKTPKHIFCLEPSKKCFKTLVKNTIGYQVTQINKGISTVDGLVDTDTLFGGGNVMESMTFKNFVETFGLERIDFLKLDCEGDEYNIFTEDNLDYLKNRANKISGEWHLSNQKEKNKFRNFRDKILVNFNYEVNSVDGIDIKWDLWNEHFIDYYNQIHLFLS